MVLSGTVFLFLSGVPLAQFPSDAVAIDKDGNLYLAGSTTSSVLPVLNAYQQQPGSATFLRSDDVGLTWTRAGNLPYGTPTALAADPKTPDVLYAGSAAGIYGSRDGGRSWELLFRGGPVRQISVDQTNPSRLLAWVSGVNLVRSSDRGATWTRIDPFPGPTQDQRFIIDPFGSPTILLPDQSYLLISQDDGTTWDRAPLPVNGLLPTLRAAFDPHHAGGIYLVQDLVSRGSRFHISIDYGRSWQERTSIPDGIQSVWPDPAQIDVIYAVGHGLWRSGDGGRSWKLVSPRVTGLLLIPSAACRAPGTLLTAQLSYSQPGVQPGIDRSANGGETWNQVWHTTEWPAVTQISEGAGCSLWLARGSGLEDGFVAKIGPGGELSWSTYLGGSERDSIRRVMADGQGNVTVTGVTRSRDFQGPFHGASGEDDVFVTRLDAGGRLVYSTVLAGSYNEKAGSLAVDASGRAAVTGLTTSPDLPATYGERRERETGFAALLDPQGNVESLSLLDPVTAAAFLDGEPLIATADGRLLWLGPGGNVIRALKLCEKCSADALTTDSAGALYVAGTTVDPEFAVTPGAYRNSARSTECKPALYFSGIPPGDIFLMRLPPGAAAPDLRSLIGADCRVEPDTILVDDEGNITVSAATPAESMPLVAPLVVSPRAVFWRGLDPPLTGAILRLSAGGRELLFSTYTSHLSAPAIAPGPEGFIYLGSELLDVRPPSGPRIDRIVHSFLGAGHIAPGWLITILGANLGPDEWTDLGLNPRESLPLELRGVAVLFDGTPVPLLAVSRDSILCVAPRTSSKKAIVEVQNRGVRSGSVEVLFRRRFGLLTRAFPAPPPYPRHLAALVDGVVRNQDGSLNGPENPAPPGSKITVFGTGFYGSETALPDPGSRAGTDSPIGPACATWSVSPNRTVADARLVPGLVSAVFQVEVETPAAPGRQTVEIWPLCPSSSVNQDPKEASNPVGFWVR